MGMSYTSFFVFNWEVPLLLSFDNFITPTDDLSDRIAEAFT